VLAEPYLSFSAFNLSGGIAASGEDLGPFSVAGTLFDSLVAGFGVRRGSVGCGGILLPEDLRSAMI
jgi:hypothetical protein